MSKIIELSVKGYKSFYETQKIRIAPVTLLAGANSSGKSSFMQPFLLMKQTMEAPYDHGVFLLNGENVKISNINQMFSNLGTKKKSSEFSVGIKLNDDYYINIYYKKSKKTGLEIKLQEFKDKDKSFSLYLGMANQEIKKIIEKIYPKFKSLLNEDNFHVVRERCFLSIELELTEIIKFYTKNLNYIIQKLIHLPGFRGNPERAYKITGLSDSFPGRFENYTATLIYNWQLNNDLEKLEKLNESLQLLGLTSEIQANKPDDTKIELKVGRLIKKSKDLVSIADFGFGVSQVLPVLVALIAAQKDQIVYLEQPEIHLHPKAQIALPQLFTNAAERGVTVIAETHSSLVLQGIQTLVATDKLKPEDVALHWFSRKKDGITEIISAELDENGAFGDCTEDFDEVMLKADNTYISAVENKIWRKNQNIK